MNQSLDNSATCSPLPDRFMPILNSGLSRYSISLRVSLSISTPRDMAGAKATSRPSRSVATLADCTRALAETYERRPSIWPYFVKDKASLLISAGSPASTKAQLLGRGNYLTAVPEP